MYNFDNLKSAIKKTENFSEIKSGNFEREFNEALTYLSQFNRSKTFDKIYLQKAAEKLIECTKIKSNEAKSYILLAYISYVFHDMPLCNQYLNIAHSLEPHSNLLKEIREMIASTPKTDKVEKVEISKEQQAKIDRLANMYKF
jgi:hypothetical protein